MHSYLPLLFHAITTLSPYFSPLFKNLISVSPLFLLCFNPLKRGKSPLFLPCSHSIFTSFSLIDLASKDRNMPSISMPSQVSNTHSELSEPKIDNQNTGCRDSRTAGCWDFLQGPSNTSYGFKNTTPKLSTFYLSTRSLEMCTEILGSESGSHIDPSLDICSNATQERQCSSVIKPWRTREICKKMKHTTNFPPPLTSISNGYGVKVQAHRGGGRLVITAIISSSAGRFYLKSERENGRMRVFLHKEYYYRRSEQQLVEKIKENGAKIRCNYNKCGNTSGSKNLTSLPLCLV